MWSRARPLMAASALVAMALPADAQGFHRGDPYGPSSGAAAHDDGFAGEFVRGSYVGAPLTRFPRPSRIVPTPWSYGTYGIPTVSGIPAAPVGHPTLTVIDAGPPRAASRRGEARGSGDGPAGVRVVTVQVPRR